MVRTNLVNDRTYVGQSDNGLINNITEFSNHREITWNKESKVNV